jgi:hypothetical protein
MLLYRLALIVIISSWYVYPCVSVCGPIYSPFSSTTDSVNHQQANTAFVDLKEVLCLNGKNINSGSGLACWGVFGYTGDHNCLLTPDNEDSLSPVARMYTGSWVSKQLLLFNPLSATIQFQFSGFPGDFALELYWGGITAEKRGGFQTRPDDGIFHITLDIKDGIFVVEMDINDINDSKVDNQTPFSYTNEAPVCHGSSTLVTMMLFAQHVYFWLNCRLLGKFGVPDHLVHVLYNNENSYVELLMDTIGRSSGQTWVVPNDSSVWLYTVIASVGLVATPTAHPTPRPSTTAPTSRPSTIAPTPRPSTIAPTPQPSTIAPTPRPSTTAPTPRPSTTAPTPHPSTITPTPRPSTTAPTPQPQSVANVTLYPSTPQPITQPTGMPYHSGSIQHYSSTGTLQLLIFGFVPIAMYLFQP